MIFNEAVNVAEDLAKAQTEGELEEPTSFTEVSPIREATELPLVPEVISSTGDVAPVASDPSLEFTDHIPTDEVEEIPLPAVTDSEPAIPEDSGEESSDEEVVPEEELPDPAVTQPPAPQGMPISEPPSTIVTEPSPSDAVSDEEKPEPTDVPEIAQSIPEASEPPAKVEVTLTTTDEDEDAESDEEGPTSTSGPSELEVEDGDDGDDEDNEDNESQPANQPDES